MTVVAAVGLSFNEVVTLTGGRLGRIDIACPICGPGRRSSRNRARAVLRIWRPVPQWAGYHCARCGLSGYARDGGADVEPGGIVQVRASIEEREEAHQRRQRETARWLWRQRRPAAGTVVERYLRELRGYGGPIPSTIGFVPPKNEHPPTMIAAFGIPDEIEPGVLGELPQERIAGIHLTRLLPDGSGKAAESCRLMIGSSAGTPIVIAPPNDLLGLAITEGVETALAVFEALGLGVWAAGSASRMPALADLVPAWVDTLDVFGEDDEAGRVGALELARRLELQSIHTEVKFLKSVGRAA